MRTCSTGGWLVFSTGLVLVLPLAKVHLEPMNLEMHQRVTLRDKHMWKQGFNKSDQIMARALMTPDELRRLDNDLCIIFEKGIKPIKAHKYYYFKYVR